MGVWRTQQETGLPCQIGKRESTKANDAIKLCKREGKRDSKITGSWKAGNRKVKAAPIEKTSKKIFGGGKGLKISASVEGREKGQGSKRSIAEKKWARSGGGGAFCTGLTYKSIREKKGVGGGKREIKSRLKKLPIWVSKKKQQCCKERERREGGSIVGDPIIWGKKRGGMGGYDGKGSRGRSRGGG